MSSQDSSPTAQAFAHGLQGVLLPAVVQCDQQMNAVLQTQEQLSLLIDKLASALQAFKASQDRPKLTEYANKLAQCRRRLRQLQQAVATINTRIQNIRSLVRKKEAQAALRRPSPAPGVSDKDKEQPKKDGNENGSLAESTEALVEEYSPPSVAELLQLLDWEEEQPQAPQLPQLQAQPEPRVELQPQQP